MIDITFVNYIEGENVILDGCLNQKIGVCIIVDRNTCELFEGNLTFTILVFVV